MTDMRKGRPTSALANSDTSVSRRRLLKDNASATLIDVGPKFTASLFKPDAQRHSVTNNVFKSKRKQTPDTTITKKDNSDFNGLPERSCMNWESHGLQRTSSGSNSERVSGSSKSDPFQFQTVPGGSSAGVPAVSNLSVSRKKVLKESSLPHLNSSDAPIDSGPKSHTSSGSAFYSMVVARQVSQAAEQAAKRTKSRPTSNPTQIVPQMLLPPLPDSAVYKIIASLLGLLILGWQICIYMNHGPWLKKIQGVYVQVFLFIFRSLLLVHEVSYEYICQVSCMCICGERDGVMMVIVCMNK